MAGTGQAHAARMQPRGHHQQPRARGLLEVVLGEPAQRAAKLHQARGGGRVAATLGGHDACFERRRRVAQRHRDEALARARLEALERVLVAGVVADHQHEARRGGQQFTGAVQRQHAAVVGQRMQHHGDVLAGLDHLVQVEDRAFAHGARERAVAPARAAAGDQVAPGQVHRAQVVVAADRDQRPLQAHGHVLDQARLAAAGGALEQQRQAGLERLLEQRAFVALRGIPGQLAQVAGGGGGFHREPQPACSAGCPSGSAAGATKKLARNISSPTRNPRPPPTRTQ